MYGHSEYLVASHEVQSQFTAWPCCSWRRRFFCIWSPLGIDAGLYWGRPYQVTWQTNVSQLVCDFRVTYISVKVFPFQWMIFSEILGNYWLSTELWRLLWSCEQKGAPVFVLYDEAISTLTKPQQSISIVLSLVDLIFGVRALKYIFNEQKFTTFKKFKVRLLKVKGQGKSVLFI